MKTGYKGLEKWQRKVKRQAAEDGYTETYLGRRRYLPDITSANWGKKSFAQRCALNTPIQGTAADICKTLKDLSDKNDKSGIIIASRQVLRNGEAYSLDGDYSVQCPKA